VKIACVLLTILAMHTNKKFYRILETLNMRVNNRSTYLHRFEYIENERDQINIKKSRAFAGSNNYFLLLPPLFNALPVPLLA
jgi:hypothetical protein